MTKGYSPVFPLSFSPEGGYLLNKNILQVVKQNLKNVMLTVPGERIFDINFGVGLKRFLFEPKTTETTERIKNRIIDQLEKYMPFINVQNINITFSEDQENTIFISLKYFVKNLSAQDVIELTVGT